MEMDEREIAITKSRRKEGNLKERGKGRKYEGRGGRRDDRNVPPECRLG